MERLGISVSDEVSIQDIIKSVKLAETMGFESVWIPEDYYYRDAISRMTILASVTKKMKLATAIINPRRVFKQKSNSWIRPKLATLALRALPQNHKQHGGTKGMHRYLQSSRFRQNG